MKEHKLAAVEDRCNKLEERIVELETIPAQFKKLEEIQEDTKKRQLQETLVFRIIPETTQMKHINNQRNLSLLL